MTKNLKIKKIGDKSELFRKNHGRSGGPLKVLHPMKLNIENSLVPFFFPIFDINTYTNYQKTCQQAFSDCTWLDYCAQEK